jgi:hypothetical protein
MGRSDPPSTRVAVVGAEQPQPGLEQMHIGNLRAERKLWSICGT